MSQIESMKLTPQEQALYEQRGYHFPVRAFTREEALGLLNRFQAYHGQVAERMKGLLPRERWAFMTETHLFLRWVYDIVSHSKVLDAVESVMGPNIIVWASQWFPKFPGDKAFVSWHQDATYWGLTPPNVTTAWIALSESTTKNGCMRVVPGTHKMPLMPQRETYGAENMLSRGQEIAVEVDEAKAVDMPLMPGEFSLHHVGIVHGSGPNNSDAPRIGLAVRYISPDVVQTNPSREIVLLVRGKDDYGHFELVDPPERDLPFGESRIHAEALDRKAGNLLPKGSPGTS
jgi:non-heme Fe2+,alpha-ketoglutarate-dependent halogenase